MKFLLFHFLIGIDCAAQLLGKTFEGRDILSVEIATPTNGRKVLVECGSQGRDWNSVTFCNHLIDIIPQNEILNKVGWSIIPVLNPDGYEYAKTNDRNWIKNRAGSGICRGVNINRNMPTNRWGGSSINACSDDYQAEF